MVCVRSVTAESALGVAFTFPASTGWSGPAVVTLTLAFVVAVRVQDTGLTESRPWSSTCAHVTFDIFVLICVDTDGVAVNELVASVALFPLLPDTRLADAGTSGITLGVFGTLFAVAVEWSCASVTACVAFEIEVLTGLSAPSFVALTWGA